MIIHLFLFLITLIPPKRDRNELKRNMIDLIFFIHAYFLKAPKRNFDAFENSYVWIFTWIIVKSNMLFIISDAGLLSII